MGIKYWSILEHDRVKIVTGYTNMLAASTLTFLSLASSFLIFLAVFAYCHLKNDVSAE